MLSVGGGVVPARAGLCLRGAGLPLVGLPIAGGVALAGGVVPLRVVGVLFVVAIGGGGILLLTSDY